MIIYILSLYAYIVYRIKIVLYRIYSLHKEQMDLQLYMYYGGHPDFLKMQLRKKSNKLL